jgi:hypothetical protein
LRIFAVRLSDAAPAGIATDVDHRRERPVDAGAAGLGGCDAGGALNEFWVPARRLAERNREDCSVTMNDVAADEQRNAEPTLFARQSLGLVD